jgi:hypothetical protein
MTKGKRTKRQTIIHKETQRKLKIVQHEPDDYPGWGRVGTLVPRKVSNWQYCLFFGGDYTRIILFLLEFINNS